MVTSPLDVRFMSKRIHPFNAYVDSIMSNIERPSTIRYEYEHNKDTNNGTGYRILTYHPRRENTIEEHTKWLEKVVREICCASSTNRFVWIIVVHIEALLAVKHDLRIVDKSRICMGVCCGLKTKYVALMGGMFKDSKYSVMNDLKKVLQCLAELSNLRKVTNDLLLEGHVSYDDEILTLNTEKYDELINKIPKAAKDNIESSWVGLPEPPGDLKRYELIMINTMFNAKFPELGKYLNYRSSDGYMNHFGVKAKPLSTGTSPLAIFPTLDDYLDSVVSFSYRPDVRPIRRDTDLISLKDMRRMRQQSETIGLEKTLQDYHSSRNRTYDGIATSRGYDDMSDSSQSDGEGFASRRRQDSTVCGNKSIAYPIHEDLSNPGVKTSTAPNLEVIESDNSKGGEVSSHDEVTRILSAYGSLGKRLRDMEIMLSALPSIMLDINNLKIENSNLKTRISTLELLIPKVPRAKPKDLSSLDYEDDDTKSCATGYYEHDSFETQHARPTDVDARSVTHSEVTTIHPSSKKVYHTRYSFFGHLIVAILESIQDRLEAESCGRYTYASSAKRCTDKIVKISSLINTQYNLELPGFSDPAVNRVMAILGRSDKSEVISMTASTLRSMSENPEIKGFYRSLLSLWEHLKKYRKYIDEPACHILYHTNNNIIKEVDYNPDDNTMLEDYPAAYDCNFEKIYAIKPSDEDEAFKLMKVNAMTEDIKANFGKEKDVKPVVKNHFRLKPALPLGVARTISKQ
ncbi:hypothetical protein HDV06_000805 [Boothiomyces sp. JEL0866]|nr:hypothetical protein HDV06_000805 [Boothiomyces sp. JEL0866]